MHVWNYLPMAFRSKLKLVYACLTLNSTTKYFVFLALIHCIIQIVLQSVAFTHDQAAATSLSAIMQQTGVPWLLGVLSDTDGDLQVCVGNPGSCEVVAESDLNAYALSTSSAASTVVPSSTATSSVVLPTSSASLSFAPSSSVLSSTVVNKPIPFPTASSATAIEDDDDDENEERRMKGDLPSSFPSTRFTKRTVLAKPQLNSTGALQSVVVSGLSGVPDDTILSTQCVEALAWPLQIFRDARREDATILAFEIWLLGISIVAILQESIPHLFASIASYTLSTAWSAYMLARDLKFQSDFRQVITAEACGGVNLLSGFWGLREGLNISILASNGIVLPLAAFLTMKLFKVYSQRTFKCVGASCQVNKVYKFVLFFGVILQLSAFFTIGAASLWIDELRTGVVGHFTSDKLVYEIVFFVTNAIEIPWLVIGWKAIRMEHNLLTIFFLAVGSLITAAWAAMFSSSAYRWTFSTWPFFACMTVLSFTLLVTSLIVAIICRSNFGKGLAHYLKVQKALEDSDFPPVYFSNDPDRDMNNKSSSTSGSNDEEKRNPPEDERNSRFTVLLPKHTMKASLSDEKPYSPQRDDTELEEGSERFSVSTLASSFPAVGSDSRRSSDTRSARKQSRVSRNSMLTRISTTSSLRGNSKAKLPTIHASPEETTPPAYSPSILDAYTRPEGDRSSYSQSYSRHSPMAGSQRMSVLSPLSAGMSSARLSPTPRSRMSSGTAARV